MCGFQIETAVTNVSVQHSQTFFPIFQTNVYPSAQKRKARPFEGFQRRAVVVVPNDETYKERVAAQAAAGNKDIPDEAIMEMKGIVFNISLI